MTIRLPLQLAFFWKLFLLNWMLSHQIAFSVRLRVLANQIQVLLATMVKDKKEKIISPHGPVVAQIDNTPV